MRQLDQLLRDCARAFRIRPGLQVRDRRAADADQVHALVRIKPRILGGDKRVRHVIRQSVD